MKFIGIDPGASGGIAAICDDTIESIPMPDTELGVWEWLSTRIDPTTDIAVIEQVWGYMPGEKKVGKDGREYQEGASSGSAMFSFGQSYGALRMALTAVGLREGVSWFAVVPRTWQGILDISPRSRKTGETKSQFKARMRDHAESLCCTLTPTRPNRITLKTCDAILLAFYCKQMYAGKSTGRSLWE